MEQRPHSSLDHYNGRQMHISRQTDWNANHNKQLEKTDDYAQNDERTGVLNEAINNAVHSTTSKAIINEESTNDLVIASNSSPGKSEEKDSEEVEMRSPSRKISQERPRLDKSQSTPAYETIIADSASFEEKLRYIRLRKQSRVEEEFTPLPEVSSSHSPSPSPVSSMFYFILSYLSLFDYIF